MDELRRSYHDELAHAKDELVRLAAVVTESIPRATAVLLDGDLEGADYIIRGDDEIDARALDLEEQCYQILARDFCQPGSECRFNVEGNDPAGCRSALNQVPQLVGSLSMMRPGYAVPAECR